MIALFMPNLSHLAGAHTINIQQRTRRQMKLIRRILILITILLVLGTPYCTIIILDALSLVPAPTYGHRVGFLFVGIAACCIMLMMLYFTQNLRPLITGREKTRKKRQLKPKYDYYFRGETLKNCRSFVPNETMAPSSSLIYSVPNHTVKENMNQTQL